MKNYIAEIIDLTGDGYINPTPAYFDNGTHPRDVAQITSISIHHDASPRPHEYDSIARYRQEAAEHYKRLGPGLQYHYKIDNVGQIFQTRPLDEWLYCVGSPENVTTLAICLDGNFEHELPTREQYEALSQLIIELCENHPEFPATYPDVRPHADFSATACCGAKLKPYVYAVQDKATAENIPDVPYDWPDFQDVEIPSAPQPAPSHDTEQVPSVHSEPKLPHSIDPKTTQDSEVDETTTPAIENEELPSPSEVNESEIDMTVTPVVTDPQPTEPVPVTVIEEPASAVPQPKVVAAAMAGTVTSLILWGLSQVNINVPAEQAAGLTTLVSFVFGYITSNK
jgi:hypothetical protein